MVEVPAAPPVAFVIAYVADDEGASSVIAVVEPVATLTVKVFVAITDAGRAPPPRAMSEIVPAAVPVLFNQTVATPFVKLVGVNNAFLNRSDANVD